MGLKVFSRKKSAANNKKVGYEPSPSGQQQQEKQQQQPQVKSRGRYSSQNSVTSRRSLRSLGSNTFGSSKQKKSTTTTTGTNYYDDNYQLEIVKQMKSRHRDGSGNYNNVRAASPDTSEESSFIEEDSWDEAWGDGGGGCGIFDDVRMLNDDDDDESGDIYSSSNELSTIKSSAPIGIPRLAGCKAWLCVEADNVSFEETTAASGGGERYDHQGQLDIYVSKRGGSVNSLKLRSYANVPRPEKSDHILVKVEVRYTYERHDLTCFVFNCSMDVFFHSHHQHRAHNNVICTLSPPSLGFYRLYARPCKGWSKSSARPSDFGKGPSTWREG